MLGAETVPSGSVANNEVPRYVSYASRPQRSVKPGPAPDAAWGRVMVDKATVGCWVGMDDQEALGFVHVSDFEFATGWVPGYADSRPFTAGGGSRSTVTPLAALERVLLNALLQPPCIVGFSGGRDSSALLAVAMRVSRREGLDPPIPVTKVYPDVPATDESSWQELVVRWVGIEEWVRHEYHDELDLLGPAATRSLRRHGPLWPATVHNREPTLAIARGGCYVDGEGGDEILSEFRITPLTQVLARVRPLDRRARRDILVALSPARLRRGVATRKVERSYSRTWVRPDVAAWYKATSTEDVLGASLTYPRAVHQTAHRRAVQTAIRNLDAIGRSLHVRYVHPFYDPEFLTALGLFGGRLGFPSRTATMRALFSDLLPDEVNARNGKVYFNNAFIRSHSRAFLETWDGRGLDSDLIDPDALRRVWSQPSIHSGTFQLVHAAWLATNGPNP
jgi:hypothetical protein